MKIKKYSNKTSSGLKPIWYDLEYLAHKKTSPVIDEVGLVYVIRFVGTENISALSLHISERSGQ
ncbi:hypothetical protein EAG11_05900 [Flavobacterium sp. 140616W15]|nr:hypothetical protein EAG11_05900 [Flavobacterium sp. 140616W15]